MIQSVHCLSSLAIYNNCTKNKIVKCFESKNYVNMTSVSITQLSIFVILTFNKFLFLFIILKPSRYHSP